MANKTNFEEKIEKNKLIIKDLFGGKYSLKEIAKKYGIQLSKIYDTKKKYFLLKEYVQELKDIENKAELIYYSFVESGHDIKKISEKFLKSEDTIKNICENYHAKSPYGVAAQLVKNRNNLIRKELLSKKYSIKELAIIFDTKESIIRNIKFNMKTKEERMLCHERKQMIKKRNLSIYNDFLKKETSLKKIAEKHNVRATNLHQIFYQTHKSLLKFSQ